jgi:hypothetical protein
MVKCDTLKWAAYQCTFWILNYVNVTFYKGMQMGTTKKWIWKGTQRKDIHIKTEFRPHKEQCKLRLQRPPNEFRIAWLFSMGYSLYIQCKLSTISKELKYLWHVWIFWKYSIKRVYLLTKALELQKEGKCYKTMLPCWLLYNNISYFFRCWQRHVRLKNANRTQCCVSMATMDTWTSHNITCTVHCLTLFVSWWLSYTVRHKPWLNIGL